MDDYIQSLCEELRSQGCAVVCFIPGELRGVDPTLVEDRLVEYGWDTIDFHTTDTFDDRP